MIKCNPKLLISGQQKNILLGNGGWGDVSPTFINCNHLMPNGPYDCHLFAKVGRIPKNVTNITLGGDLAIWPLP